MRGLRMNKTCLCSTLGLTITIILCFSVLKFASNPIAPNLQQSNPLNINKTQNLCLYTSTINTPFLYCKNIENKFDAIYFFEHNSMIFHNSSEKNIEIYDKNENENHETSTQNTNSDSNPNLFLIALALTLPFIIVFLILIIPHKTNKFIQTQNTLKKETHIPKKQYNDDEML